MNATRTASQANRQVQVGSPLGPDVLLFHKLTAHERLSGLFELELELYSNDPKLKAKDLLAQNMTVAWKWDPDGEERYWSGICMRFGLLRGDDGMSVYRATLVPPMWFLTQTRNSRIFHEMSVADIVKAVLGDHGINPETCDGMTETLEYCVQWEESDYAFICRLMERHGSYFYHAHENGAVKLHIVEAGHSHPSMPQAQPVPVRQPGSARGHMIEYLDSFSQEGRIRPDTYTAQDYNFLTPRASLEGSETIATEYDTAKLEVYRYQAGQRDGNRGGALAKVGAEAMQSDANLYLGAGNARAVAAGYCLEIDKSGGADWMSDTELLCIESLCELVEDGYESRASAGGETTFAMQMRAVPKSTKWRAKQETPWPRIHGVQSAVVVNANGEELDVDEHGRICVAFSWERQGEASMRARVSQMWAGAEWGMAMWPRNGQEVLVEHLNGDPDRPIVTGRVYNDAARPPHDPSSDASIMSIKSRSTPGGGGFNALEFQDKAGEEYVFVHSQKDTHLRTGEKHIELVGTEEHVTVGELSKRKVDGDQHESVTGDNKLKVQGANHVKVTSDQLVKSDANIVEQAGQNVHIKGGMNVVIEAGTQLTLKVGGNFVVISQMGVDIKGAMVKINSGGAAGSGPGTAAQAAEDPEEPMEDEPGSEAPAARSRDWAAALRAISSNPAAAAMLAASKSGAPFCEVCEQARKKKEAEKKKKADAKTGDSKTGGGKSSGGKTGGGASPSGKKA